MKNLKNGAFAWLWENPPLVGNETTLEVRVNISPAINIAMSVRVTERAQVLGHSKVIKNNSEIVGWQCIYIACEILDGTTQQVDSGIA